MPTQQLVGDVPTRWGSKYDMISRYLIHAEAVTKVLQKDRKISHLQLSGAKTSALRSIEVALKPLSELTNLVSGDTYPTASTVLPLLEILSDIVTEAHENAECTPLTKNILDHVLNYMNDRYDAKMRELLSVITFLDPRYKRNYFDDSCYESVKATILSQMVISSREGDFSKEPKNSVDAPSEDQPPAKKPTLTLSLTDRMKKRAMCSVSSGSDDTDLLLKEFELYSTTAVTDPHTNPLEWWNCNSKSYPHLAIAARKYLAIPATSTSSERLFSYAGMVITSKRNKLNPSTAEQLIFLSKNL